MARAASWRAGEHAWLRLPRTNDRACCSGKWRRLRTSPAAKQRGRVHSNSPKRLAAELRAVVAVLAALPATAGLTRLALTSRLGWSACSSSVLPGLDPLTRLGLSGWLQRRSECLTQWKSRRHVGALTAMVGSPMNSPRTPQLSGRKDDDHFNVHYSACHRSAGSRHNPVVGRAHIAGIPAALPGADARSFAADACTKKR